MGSYGNGPQLHFPYPRQVVAFVALGACRASAFPPSIWARLPRCTNLLRPFHFLVRRKRRIFDASLFFLAVQFSWRMLCFRQRISDRLLWI